MPSLGCTTSGVGTAVFLMTTLIRSGACGGWTRGFHSSHANPLAVNRGVLHYSQFQLRPRNTCHIYQKLAALYPPENGTGRGRIREDGQGAKDRLLLRHAVILRCEALLTVEHGPPRNAARVESEMASAS
jgi:hypothetical protein